MGNTNNKPNKLAALITYLIALVCLLVGLAVPLGNTEGFTADNILAWQLPGAVNSIVGSKVLGFGAAFTYSFPVNLNGWLPKSFDLGAVLALLYALIAVAGIVAAIPVIASKKDSATALKAASFIEVLSVAVLSVMIFCQLVLASLAGENFLWSYSLLIAFGGTLLMLIIQSFVYKKGSGVVKFVLLLLSSLVLLFTIFDITAIIPALKQPLEDLCKSMGNLGLNLYTNGSGIITATLFFSADFGAAVEAIENPVEKCILIFTLIVSILAFLNVILDLLGLGKKTNRGMLIANDVRYGLQIICTAVIIILVAITDGYNMGLLVYVLAALTLISLLINIIRSCMYTSPKKEKVKEENKVKENRAQAAAEISATAATAGAVNNNEAKPALTYETNKERKLREKREKEELKAKQAAEKEAEKARKAEEKQAVAAATAVPVAETAAETENKPVAQTYEETTRGTLYNPIIYNGPSDEFINRLSNELKLEFARVFLERNNGNLSFIPQYTVGGNNNKFFSSVFIYYGRLRDLISDGLMNEFFKQNNAMN